MLKALGGDAADIRSVLEEIASEVLGPATGQGTKMERAVTSGRDSE